MGILELTAQNKQTIYVNMDAIKYFTKDVEDKKLTYIAFKNSSWMYVIDTPKEIVEKINAIYW